MTKAQAEAFLDAPDPALQPEPVPANPIVARQVAMQVPPAIAPSASVAAPVITPPVAAPQPNLGFESGGWSRSPILQRAKALAGEELGNVGTAINLATLPGQFGVRLAAQNLKNQVVDPARFMWAGFRGDLEDLGQTAKAGVGAAARASVPAITGAARWLKRNVLPQPRPGRVTVIAPDGTVGDVPEQHLDAAIDAGYKLAQ